MGADRAMASRVAESFKAQSLVELQPAGIKGGQLQGGVSKFQCYRHHTMLWAWRSAGDGIVARLDANGGPRCCGNGDPHSIATSQARVQRLEGHPAPGWLQRLLTPNPYDSRAQLFNAVGFRRQARQADAEIKPGLVRFGVQHEVRLT